MRKLYGVAFALIVLISVTMSAVALTSKTIYRQNGESVYAEWTDPNGSNTFLSITKTNLGTDIYLSVCTPDSCKYGYTLTQENVLDIQKKLNSAILNSVDIELLEWVCDESNCWETFTTATIQAEWTGTGDIQKGSYKWMSKYNDYVEKGSSSSSFREAKATGSIVIGSDSRDLGQSKYGGLAIFKSASMQMQK